jgi:hypothetical protein
MELPRGAEYAIGLAHSCNWQQPSMHINFGLSYGKVFLLTAYGVYISSSSRNFDTRIKLVCGRREICAMVSLGKLLMYIAPKSNAFEVSELHDPQV